MASKLEHCQQLAARRELVGQIISKNNEEGRWEAFQAKDVPKEILEEVEFLLEQGLTPLDVRRQLKLGSATGHAWRKISAALKMGFRVNSTAWFARIMMRNERIGDKLFQILDEVLEQDVETLMIPDKKGVPLLSTYSKYITPMIDAYNRLNQGSAALGKQLGVFSDGSAPGGGSSGVTIVVQNNVPLPTPEEYYAAKTKKPDIEVKNESSES